MEYPPGPFGFSRYMSRGTVVEGPNHGFAQHMSPTKPGFAPADETVQKPQKRQRPPKADRGPSREKYPFPDMVVASRLAWTALGREWRHLQRDLEKRALAIGGRAIGLSEMECVYIGSDEMNAAMSERYTSVAANPNVHVRRDHARRTLGRINDLLGRMQRCDNEVILEHEGAESPDLRRRALDPDSAEWFTYKVGGKDADKLPAGLWQKQEFRVERQEGCGPYGIGVSLDDTSGFHRLRRFALVSALCDELGFNPRHFYADITPKIAMVDTSPRPIGDLRLDLPPIPTDGILRPPHAHFSSQT